MKSFIVTIKGTLDSGTSQEKIPYSKKLEDLLCKKIFDYLFNSEYFNNEDVCVVDLEVTSMVTKKR